MASVSPRIYTADDAEMRLWGAAGDADDCTRHGCRNGGKMTAPPHRGTPMTEDRTKQVSFHDEPLIVVDEDDNVLEYRTKADCHAGEGILHRALSVFVFDGKGRVLLQRRSAKKPLWPLYWANSCCSHPRRGETELAAAARRLEEELGLRAEPFFLYRFQYHASFEDRGAEHELCSVFVARSDDAVAVNDNEIADCRWIEPDELDRALAEEPDVYTPWLKLEWARIREAHWLQIESLLAG